MRLSHHFADVRFFLEKCHSKIANSCKMDLTIRTPELIILEQISLIIFLFKPFAYCPKIIKRRMPLNILLLLVQTRVTKEKSFKSFYANILKRKEYVIYSDDR